MFSNSPLESIKKMFRSSQDRSDSKAESSHSEHSDSSEGSKLQEIKVSTSNVATMKSKNVNIQNRSKTLAHEEASSDSEHSSSSESSKSEIIEDSTSNVESMNTKHSNVQNKKKTNMCFRIFFPRFKNKDYPTHHSHNDACIFEKTPLPTVFELRLLQQICDIDTLYEFRSYSKDKLMQLLLVKKKLRMITNLYKEVEYYVIEEKIDTDTDIDILDGTCLIKLTEQQAVDRFIKYMHGKAAKLPKIKEVVKIEKHPFNTLRDVTIKSFNSIYGKTDLIKNPDDINWYSIIHSLYEPFDFILYDQSHRIKSDIKIHECLKVKLSFPAGKSMFIIFNGHLAHNGASAIENKELTSFNFMNSLRLFSYIDKVSEIRSNTKNTKGVRTRSSKSNKISDQEIDKKVDKNHTQLCENCAICNDIIPNYRQKDWHRFGTLGNGCLKLDLLECLNYTLEMSKKKRKPLSSSNENKKQKKQKISDTSHVSRCTMQHHDASMENRPAKKPLLIAGGLPTHGWAVFVGVDLSQNKHYGVIDEMESIVNKHGYKNHWKTIDHEERKGERQMFMCNKLGETNETSKFKATNLLFEEIQSNVRTLKHFNQCDLKFASRSILRNNKNTPEQIIHRDQTNTKYSAVTKNKK